MYKNMDKLANALLNARNFRENQVSDELRERYPLKSERELTEIQRKHDRAEALYFYQKEVSKTAYLNGMTDEYLLEKLNIIRDAGILEDWQSKITSITLEHAERIDQIFNEWIFEDQAFPDFDKKSISFYEQTELGNMIFKYLPELRQRNKLASKMPVRRLADLKRNQIPLFFEVNERNIGKIYCKFNRKVE